MTNYIIAKQNARNISGDDKIFGVSKLAQETSQKIGKENVTNATIGAFLDDKGQLMVMPTVVEVLRALNPEEYANYAPIAGVPEFLRIAQSSVFGEFAPQGYSEAVATPGGTGAVRNAIQNYSECGDVILTSSWHWSPYATIAGELQRKIETYEMFTPSGAFHTASFSQKLNEILSKQNNLVILFNAPAHNPTGFSPSDTEWDSILLAMKDAVKEKNKNIIFLVDAAYIDFAGNPIESRRFFQKFNNLPDNLLLLTAFSMSKGFTLYGMRGGALIATSKNKEIVEEFKKVNAYSCRATWSNCSQPSMATLMKIYRSPELLEKVNVERAYFNEIMTSRGKAFIQAAKDNHLTTCPFNAGFFITIPCKNDEEVAKELYKDAIFSVAIGGGVRFAISSVSEEKCALAPSKIAAAIAKTY